MADTPPLGGLLDRAGHVFSLAYQLGRMFQEEHERRRGHILATNPDWRRHLTAYEAYASAVLALKDPMQNPPDGFAVVAEALLEAARVAKQIKDSFKSADTEAFTTYLDFWPHLNSVAETGRRAIREAAGAGQTNDPFAFLDKHTPRYESDIDTTPTLPQPPKSDIEAASRDIPRILLDVPRQPGGTVELVAALLATRLRDAKHTLAAAHWAIHEAVQAGRLRAGRVEVSLPQVIVPESTGLPPRLFGSHGHIPPRAARTGGPKPTTAIPKGKPAPYDCFKVIATELLWAWCRSQSQAESPTKETTNGMEQFIERLLSGPGDVELLPREMAMLGAYLKQPVDIEALYADAREAERTGRSPGQNKRNKLRLIYRFNRRLKAEPQPSATSGAGDVAKPGALPPTPSVNPAPLALLRVFTNGLSDERIEQAAQVLATDAMTANEKLTKIDGLISIPATASADQLGAMLRVTKQAVMKTKWWIENRKGEKEDEIGRRRAGHKKRAEGYDPPNANQSG